MALGAHAGRALTTPARPAAWGAVAALRRLHEAGDLGQAEAVGLGGGPVDGPAIAGVGVGHEGLDQAVAVVAAERDVVDVDDEGEEEAAITPAMQTACQVRQGRSGMPLQGSGCLTGVEELACRSGRRGRP